MKNIECKNNFGKIVSVPAEKFVFRPSVYGVIIKNGKVLLLRNKSDKKFWFPGGGVDIGEKNSAALKREVKEETGFEVKPKELLLVKENFFYYEPEDAAFQAYLFFYRCEIVSGKLHNPEEVNDTESENPNWFEIKKLKKVDFSDLNEDIWKMLAKLK